MTLSHKRISYFIVLLFPPSSFLPLQSHYPLPLKRARTHFWLYLAYNKTEKKMFNTVARSSLCSSSPLAPHQGKVRDLEHELGCGSWWMTVENGVCFIRVITTALIGPYWGEKLAGEDRREWLTVPSRLLPREGPSYIPSLCIDYGRKPMKRMTS